MSTQSNTPFPKTEKGTFRVTHPYHPLFGRVFELLATRSNWGMVQAYYHDDAGRLRMMPIAWTSLRDEDPVVRFGLGQAPFKLADLLELSRFLEGIQLGHETDQGSSDVTLQPHGGVK